jgi:hypothetical protein
MNALFILAPFPFLRGYFRKFPPYVVIFITALFTIGILSAAGGIGGDAVIHAQSQSERILEPILFPVNWS